MSVADCAALVERGDPDRFLAAMAAPVEARRVLFPLYAFNLEVARAPWLTQEPMIAEMRLQWWRDVLDEISSGGPVRRHEVATSLSEVLDADAAAALGPLVDARSWDAGRAPFADKTAFSAHIDATAGTLMWVAARALGASTESQATVRDFAWGQGLASWFQAVPAMEEAGRVPMADGRPKAVKTLAREGLERISRARRNRRMVSKGAAPALLPGWLSGPLLRQAATDPAAVAEGRLGVSEFRRRAGLLAMATTGRW